MTIRNPDRNNYSEDPTEQSRLEALSKQNFEKFVSAHGVTRYLSIGHCACKVLGKEHRKDCAHAPQVDHGRLFRTHESRVFTYQPYFTNFGKVLVCHGDTPLEQFTQNVKQYAEARGLESSVSFDSFYFPTRTLLVVLRKANVVVPE